ncbi:ABC transporter permease/substrate-binding protein [Mucisphaera sp.]|uniref:ABC transporter permease/substrate-binding protein n=1 Tax=Mucisphaera sp. TaxID=2913024 RepID=UPI003D120AD6
MTDWAPLLEGTGRLLAWHLLLVLIAIAIASALSVPLGIYLARGHDRLRALALAAASVLQTIPGLAFLALIFMLIVALNQGISNLTGSDETTFRAIGLLPALIALTLYAILPILRNTIVGIRAIDPKLLEAADGMGLTLNQRRRWLELPLAAPAILAGIRTATVWTVGIATLSTLIGQPSLGDPIIAGLQTLNEQQVILGCLLAAGLAIILDGLLAGLEHAVANRKTARALAFTGCLLASAVAAAITLMPAATDTSRPTFIVGAKTFNESYVLGHLLGQQLEATHTIEHRTGLGSTVAFEALRNNEIDAYVDYSGTIWATLMNRTEALPAAELRDQVRVWLEAEHNVISLGSLGFENAYALAVRRSLAEEHNLQTLEDLARHAPQLSIAADPEFYGRAEWQRVQAIYNLNFGQRLSMQSTLLYEAARSAEVDVITAYTTDGRIVSHDLVLLEDPKAAFPPYEALILLAPNAGQNPDIKARLQPLIGAISADLMRAINLRVDQEGLLPAQAANDIRLAIDTPPPNP